VFHTPWFQILARRLPSFQQPYYAIHAPDVAVVVALNRRRHLLLVRQFRPAVGMVTLELPAGHVESGETPEQTARKELCEETGYEADEFELLATLSPAAARFTNRVWVFFAANVRLAVPLENPREPGVAAVFHRGSLRSLITKPGFISSASCAALFAAAARGKLVI
jgi:ADP-ribose pyrophosphatase